MPYDDKMTVDERRKYLSRMKKRYDKADRKEKSRLLDEMVAVVRTGQGLTEDAVRRSAQMLRARADERPADVLTMRILSHRGRTIRPKTLNQKRYVDAMRSHDIVFAVGPAGTGKTYLAVAMAAEYLARHTVHRLILVRPRASHPPATPWSRYHCR